NSRIVFKPSKDDKYRIIVTSFNENGNGNYTLTIEVSSGADAKLLGLKAEFTAKQQELEASFKMAKTGEERQKIISRFFELNAEYLVSVARFAEENAKDAVADKARDELRTHLLQNLRSLAESDSPVIGKALSTLAEKAPKELRGPLHLALAQNLRTQYEQAHQKKD